MRGMKILAAAVMLAMAAPPAPAAVAQVTAKAGPLVDVAWLRANLGDPGIVVLDATGNPAAFAQGHIPGAVYTHYARDNWRVDGRRNGRKVSGVLPPVDHMEKLIGGLGIGNDDHVVIVANGFSAGEMGTATRLYWTFKVLGHDAVSILNGGMAAWTADRQKPNPLEAGVRKPAPKSFTANYRPELIADAQEVKAALENGTTLIDSRPADQNLGLNKSGSVRAYGTIPGAISVPGAYMTVNGGGEIRDAEALGRLFAASRAPTEGKAITFCNTGHWASLGWFVQSEILGNKQTAMYDGSLADWTTEDGAPMERRIKLD